MLQLLNRCKPYIYLIIINLILSFNCRANDNDDIQPNDLEEVPLSANIDTDSKSIFDLFTSSDSEEPNDDNDFKASSIEIRVVDIEPSITNESKATLRVIDKTLGKLYNIDVDAKSKASLNEMTFKLINCAKVTSITLIPEDRALIEIYETRNRATELIFKGWLFALQPSVSKLAHFKYDVTLSACKKS